MELEAPLKHAAEVAVPEPEVKKKSGSAFVWTLGIFLALWVAFYALDRRLPYFKNGSDIVWDAKWRMETSGQVFPAKTLAQRVLIFGDSKTLAGFLPPLFDQLAASRNLPVTSFNSGFPGSDVFLPQLKAMCERGQAPDVLLLTLPWKADPPPRGIFHLVQDDHAVIQEFFPFRNLLRDFTDFLMAARDHGGILGHYREAREDEKHLVADRGYYLITEQSRFPGGRIPDDFHLETDTPDKTNLRSAPTRGSQVRELSALVRQYHMQCYYMPMYYRIGEFAPPPARNQAFAATVETATPCRLLGPDYFLYPNRYFSDQTHMNTAGARVYTEDLFRVIQSAIQSPIQNPLGKGNGRALQ